MTPLAVGVIGLVLMVILLLLKMPVGFVLGLVGFAGIWHLSGLDTAVKMTSMTAYTAVNSYILSCICLFILMGQFAFYSGIGAELYGAAQKWVGHVRGGLAISTQIGCGALGGIVGDSISCALIMGSVAYPEMRKHGYSKSLATGCIAAGGTVGGLIPPSMMFVLMGYLTGESVGKLLISGILPGILQVVAYSLIIYVFVTFRREWAPPTLRAASWKEKLGSLKGIWAVLVIFLVVIGGIYSGMTTPTEAAAVGAFAIFLLVVLLRRLNWPSFKTALVRSTIMSANVLMIVAGAMIFNGFMAVTTLPMELSALLEGWGLPRYIVLTFVILLYLALGCIMNTLAMVVLTLPITYPIMVGMGFNGIWLCVIIMRLMEVGLITPPVGLNVFVLKSIIKDVSMGDMFKGIVPFLYADVVCLALLVIFPIISTFLPSLM